MRRITLLLGCVVCGSCGTHPPQHTRCPAIEVSVVADAPTDSTRSVPMTDGGTIFLTRTPLVTSADVTGAHVSLTEGQYVLNVDVTAEGAKRVQRFSERNVGRTLAFLVDGRVLRTPRIRDPITSNGFLIGAFERAEAERLADAINDCCDAIPGTASQNSRDSAGWRGGGLGANAASGVTDALARKRLEAGGLHARNSSADRQAGSLSHVEGTR